MAITREQLLNIGFKPSKRAKSLGRKKYDTLIYNLNSTDYVYLGYNTYTKQIDFKRLWKSIMFHDGDRYTFPVEKLKELTLSNVKEYIKQEIVLAKAREARNAE